MIDSNRILQEKDPLLREIWRAEYTIVETDYVMDRIRLVNSNNKIIKDIPMMEWRTCLLKLRFKMGYNDEGEVHTWIKEADGSADLFRSLIK